MVIEPFLGAHADIRPASGAASSRRPAATIVSSSSGHGRSIGSAEGGRRHQAAKFRLERAAPVRRTRVAEIGHAPVDSSALGQTRPTGPTVPSFCLPLNAAALWLTIGRTRLKVVSPRGEVGSASGGPLVQFALFRIGSGFNQLRLQGSSRTVMRRSSAASPAPAAMSARSTWRAGACRRRRPS
jgi:hypothetical protein